MAFLVALVSLGLALVSCGGGSGGKVVAGESRTQDGSDKSSTPATSGGTESVEFRPVLSVSEPGSTVTTLTGSASEADKNTGSGSSEPVGPEGGLAATDPVNDIGYLLGPVALDASQIESATSVLSQGQWQVELVLKDGPEGIDKFNEMAQKCFDGSVECPELGAGRGQIAIVFDGDVISAPAINVPIFERDQISISGSFDADTAAALAEAINNL